MRIYIVAFGVMVQLHAQMVPQLNKIYVHHAPLEQESQKVSQLEPTKAVLYFSSKPDMSQPTCTINERNGWKHEVHFFAVDEMKSSCRESLLDMQEKTTYYQTACTEVSEPHHGLRVEISYDPQHIMCVRESFDAITAEKGVVFRLVNKRLLDDMSTVNKSVSQSAGNKARRVVLDFGHGGRDPGAIGVGGIVEKEITMHVGQKLARLLREKGCEVILTRDTDIFVPLTTRTQIVNMHQPDAYISIHANSSPHLTANGIETYCLSSHLFAGTVPADAAGSLFKQLLQSRYDKSDQLAHTVHTHLLSRLSSCAVGDRKVRHAVPQVLLGTSFPGILIEVGFLTHPEEAARLAQSDYQDKLAHGMCEGLMAHFAA